MTQLRSAAGRFRMRAAGVAVHDGHVLLSRGAQPSSWTNVALLGGGVELHETSEAAVVREFREELGVDVRAERLLWLVENHFRHEGEPFHEVGFYWLVDLPPVFPRSGRGAFHERPEDTIEWFWQPLDRLEGIELKPSFLIDGLRDLPRTTRFLVHRDE